MAKRNRVRARRAIRSGRVLQDQCEQPAEAQHGANSKVRHYSQTIILIGRACRQVSRRAANALYLYDFGQFEVDGMKVLLYYDAAFRAGTSYAYTDAAPNQWHQR
jgi:hypothetical protein